MGGIIVVVSFIGYSGCEIRFLHLHNGISLLKIPRSKHSQWNSYFILEAIEETTEGIFFL